MFYKRLVTILAVALCLFATGAPLSTVTAQANGANVYYITDNPNYSNMSSAVTSAVDSYFCIPYNGTTNWAALGSDIENDYENNFEKGIRYYWQTMWFEQNIADNSYVIFEMSDGLSEKTDPVPVQSYFTDVLEDIFSYLKETKSCQIAFVCDTDETRFSNYNDFLDYVDLHINTDLRTVFVYSLLNYYGLLNYDSNQVTSTSLIFDENSMTEHAGANIDKTKGIAYIVRAIFQFLSIKYAGTDNYTIQGVADACSEKGLYLYDEGDGYFLNNLWNQETTEMCDIETTNVGLVLCPNYIILPLDIVEYLRDAYGVGGFDLFFYGSNTMVLGDYPTSAVKMCYMSSEYYVLKVSAALEAFLSVNGAGAFDNWEGRCAISHKIIGTGNGWLIGASVYEDYVIGLYD